jgi:two-component system chemotaxis response regulator CheB
MTPHDIVVIAGSAGSVEEMRTLVGGLPSDFPGSLFIVLHTSAEGPSLLAGILGRGGLLPVVRPENNEAIRAGHVYVPPPDTHLLISPGRIELGKGPRENGFRPAADPLFRTAAAAYGPRVVGIVLSGGMDDGTLGLQAIKAAGGVAIVQDPSEATYPYMPESALRHVAIDHVLKVEAMPRLLMELCRSRPATGNRRIRHKHGKGKDLALVGDLATTGPRLAGPPTAFICPECGGSLWEFKNGSKLHYRCHVGHAYTADSLVVGQDTSVEEALWTALRTLDETAALRRRLANEARGRKMAHLAAGYESRAHLIEQRAGVIRKVLLNDDLPKRMRHYGSSKPSRLLSRQSVSRRNQAAR